jgi:hypothetical protein
VTLPLEKVDQKQELPIEFLATIEGNDRAILKVTLVGKYRSKLKVGTLKD